MVDKKVSQSKKTTKKPAPAAKSVDKVSVAADDKNAASNDAKDLKVDKKAADTSKTATKSKAGLKLSKKSKVDTTSKESIAVKARSGNPAKRGEITKELSERKKSVQAVKISNIGPNPGWLVPTFLGLMVIGVIWIVTFYLTAQIGGYPMPVLNYWNLVVGFVFIISGFLLTTKWR